MCACGGKLGKRKDDEESVVRDRLKKYEAETRPVSDYYADRLIRVSGEGKPEEVAQRVDEALARFGIKKRRLFVARIAGVNLADKIRVEFA